MRTGSLHSLDMTLLLGTITSMVLGVALVFSATKSSHGEPFGLGEFTARQAIYGLIGLVIMLIISRLDYRFMESFTIPFYVVSLGLLGIVILAGMTEYGSQRWINLGLFPIQPSELAKLSLIVILAKLYADHERELGKIKWFALAALITLIPAAVVLRQPDLGTTMILIAVFGGITLAARVSMRILIGTAVLIIPFVFVFWNWVMQQYQRDRLFIFLDPQSDPLGQGYNMIQARTAIGAGGLFGQGFMSGSQSQLEFVKVQYSDFIFSVVAEEFGFVGSCALIALLFLVVWRCIIVAQQARDTFGSLMAVGVATWISVQIFINIGMNIGLMPVTGIPLPFVSYGGSSLMSILLGLGLVQSVALHSSPVIFGGNRWRPGWGRANRTTLRPR